MSFVCAECGNNISSVTCRECMKSPVGKLPAEVWKRSPHTHSLKPLQQRQQEVDDAAQRTAITSKVTSYGLPRQSRHSNTVLHFHGLPLPTTTLPPLRTPPYETIPTSETKPPPTVFLNMPSFDTEKPSRNGLSSPLTNERTEDAYSSDVANTVHCIQFQGDVWESVFPHKELELQEALALDISNTLPVSCIASVSVTNTSGGFLVYCSVRYPKHFGGEYIDQCLNNYHYPATRRIYQRSRLPYLLCPPPFDRNFYEKEDAYTQGNCRYICNTNEKKQATQIASPTAQQSSNEGGFSLTAFAPLSELSKSPIQANTSRRSLDVSSRNGQEFLGVYTPHQQAHNTINCVTETGLTKDNEKLSTKDVRLTNLRAQNATPHQVVLEKVVQSTLEACSISSLPPRDATMAERRKVSFHTAHASVRSDDERSLALQSFASLPPHEARMAESRKLSFHTVQASVRPDDERSLAQQSIASLPPHEARMAESRKLSFHTVQASVRPDDERSLALQSFASLPPHEARILGDTSVSSDPVNRKLIPVGEDIIGVVNGPLVNDTRQEPVSLVSSMRGYCVESFDDGELRDLTLFSRAGLLNDVSFLGGAKTDGSDGLDDVDLSPCAVSETRESGDLFHTRDGVNNDSRASLHMKEIIDKSDDALLDSAQKDIDTSVLSSSRIYPSPSPLHESLVDEFYGSGTAWFSESFVSTNTPSKGVEKEPVAPLGGDNCMFSPVPLSAYDRSDPTEQWLNVPSAAQQMDDSAKRISRIAVRGQTGTVCRHPLLDEDEALFKDRGQSLRDKSPNKLMLSFVEREIPARHTNASSRMSTCSPASEIASFVNPSVAQPMAVAEKGRENEGEEQQVDHLGLYEVDDAAASEVRGDSYCVEVYEVSVSDSSDASVTDIWVPDGRLTGLSQLLRDLEEADRLLRQPVKLLRHLRAHGVGCD